MAPKLQLIKRRDDYYRHFTALDIGTDMVKALVIRRDKRQGTVLGVGREPQEPIAMSGGAIADIESVIRSANRALEAAEDMAGLNPPPGQAVVGVAGELVKGFCSSAAYPRTKPDSKIREVEIRNLLNLLQKRALREAQHLLELERSYGELDARLVHSAITGVRIDGYPIANPLGFAGHNLDITVFNTFAPLTHISAIETVVVELDLELVAAVAQPYAIARACADEQVYESGGIFVDVGGGTTDVALMRDGGIEGTRMFNLGGRSFTRRLSTALGVSLEQAEAKKLRHSERLLPADEERRVADLMRADAEVLIRGLVICLDELSRGERLPAPVYLCGGGSLLPEVVDELRRGAWATGLPFVRPPEVRLLMPSDVASLKDGTGLLTSPRDIGPMALADHALRLEADEKDVVNAVMRRVLKSMKV
ncbi:MAG TPA: cell division FtsA domain-containing protein [Candidatus Dormibacteraeota bacterium]|nr:cell division FtsA domain-containing protein [Candidatus Dormibacteraeota bacterium]